MKFKYLGNKELKQKMENASSEEEFKKYEREYYSELPYIVAYGIKFERDVEVDVDHLKPINDEPNAPLVVNKLKNNPHFECLEKEIEAKVTRVKK